MLGNLVIIRGCRAGTNWSVNGPHCSTGRTTALILIESTSVCSHVLTNNKDFHSSVAFEQCWRLWLACFRDINPAMISLHSACCIMYSTVQRLEALQHARDPLKVMAGVLCRYHKMSEDRKTGFQANWRVAGLALVRTSHSVSVDLGFLSVVCLCIPHCITFSSATKQNGGKRILTEISLSDGGRGLTQMCKNCLRMEKKS